jgi:hypothetical protein
MSLAWCGEVAALDKLGKEAYSTISLDRHQTIGRGA